jgi:hypothetical protein
LVTIWPVDILWEIHFINIPTRLFIFCWKNKEFYVEIPYMSIWCFFLISNANKLHFMFYWFTLFLYCATDYAAKKKQTKICAIGNCHSFWVSWTFSCLVHSSPFSVELQYFISLLYSLTLYTQCFLSIKHHFGIRSTNDKHLSLTGGSQNAMHCTSEASPRIFHIFNAIKLADFASQTCN